MKFIYVLTTGIGIGLVSGILWISHRTQANRAPVVTAARDVPAGTVFRDLDSALTIAWWPKELIPPDAFRSVEGVPFKRLAHTIKAGEPLTQRHIADPNDLFPRDLPDNIRAITVRIREPFPPLRALPGARVDLIAVTKDQISMVVLENALVLAIGEGSNPKPGEIGVITIAAPLEDMLRVAETPIDGHFVVAIRRGVDNTKADKPGEAP